VSEDEVGEHAFVTTSIRVAATPRTEADAVATCRDGFASVFAIRSAAARRPDGAAPHRFLPRAQGCPQAPAEPGRLCRRRAAHQHRDVSRASTPQFRNGGVDRQGDNAFITGLI